MSALHEPDRPTPTKQVARDEFPRLECDEDKEAFERKLGKIAKVKPKPTKRES